ncbi:MAG: DUF2252 domain-containing protein [Acidobacteria bacterium]|nr:DUF2252 domain-containing protein [Acidobacteriota bacterium]
MQKNDELTQRILRFNRGRHPQLLRLKYDKMRMNAFIFLRGTCHLFFADWPQKSILNEAPRVWICGDLHLENFGSYKGDNRLVYFDMNDFDEAALAPCTWDLARLMISTLVGAESLGFKESTALALCEHYLEAYVKALATGRSRYVEQETARGLVRDLLVRLSARNRKDFLNERTKVVAGRRVFRTDHPRLLAAGALERDHVKDLFKAWAARQPEPAFYKLHDIVRRIAGTGSLGVERFILLVGGKGGPNNNYLLDLKEERPSALQPLLTQLKLPQPRWANQAARVAECEQRVQSTPPALLAAINYHGKSYILRELQPTLDRVSLISCKGNLAQLQPVLETMGETTAWAQLRSGGRQGSAIADELMAFAQKPKWQRALLQYVKSYSQRVNEDYAQYCQAYDAGAFKAAR